MAEASDSRSAFLRVACGCGVVLKVPASRAGRTIRCVKCQAPVTVPNASDSPVRISTSPQAAPPPEQSAVRRPWQLTGAARVVLIAISVGLLLYIGSRIVSSLYPQPTPVPIEVADAPVEKSNAPPDTPPVVKSIENAPKAEPPKPAGPRVEVPLVFERKPSEEVPTAFHAWKCKAGHVYWLELKDIDPRLFSVQSPDHSPEDDLATATNRVFVVEKDCEFTVVIVPRDATPAPCSLIIHEMDDGHPIPLDLRPPSTAGALPILVQADLPEFKPFVTAAFHPGSKSFWVSRADKTLNFWDAETLTRKRSFKADSLLRVLGVDRMGRVYAQAGEAESPVIGDLLVWQGLEEKVGPKLPEPDKVLPFRGAVGRMSHSPDGKWLYLLDVRNGCLSRIDVDTCAIESTIDMSEGANQFCLSPNGKTIYCCSEKNTIDIVAAEMFKKQMTIAIEQGTPRDIAATDAGVLYLSGTGEQAGFAVDLKHPPARVGKVHPIIPLDTANDRPENVLVLNGQRTLLFQSDKSLVASAVVDRPALFRPRVRSLRAAGVQSIERWSRPSLSPDGQLLVHPGGTVFSVR